MKHVKLSDAETSLGALIDEAENGATIEIIRDGKAVARIIPAPKARVDVDRLRALAKQMPYQEESAGDFVRRMRDDERY